MFKIKSFLTIIICFFATIVCSQNIRIGVQTGYGSYKMDELKWVTNNAFENLPFKSKIISNYPGYLYYKPSVQFSYQDYSIGFQLAKYSTGSRISSKDYSGEYLFDTKINSIVPSLYFDFGHYPVLKRFKLSPFFESGVIFTKFNIKEYFTLNDQELINDTYNLNSKNYFGEAGLKVEYIVYKNFSIEFNSSYAFQYGKNNLKTDEGGAINGENGAARTNWSGIRIGLSFFVSFPMFQ